MKDLMTRHGLYDPRFEHDSCGVGFVCDIKGKKSHDVVRKGIEVLEHLSHRGAVGSDPKTGDGAGILIQIPHLFLSKACGKNGITLPGQGDYGTGLVFLPGGEKDKLRCVEIFERIIREEGQALLGWRDVPVDSSRIGKNARETMPDICQVFIGKDKDVPGGPFAFERKLYVMRRRLETAVRLSNIREKTSFYITNLSSRTMSYKGLLMPSQVKGFFPDLQDEGIESAICLVHSRYSTNTFPTWDLAQPFRFLAHNGEINTLRGNINWMRARERLMASGAFGADIGKLKPVIIEGGSDSATLDNVFELLTLSGRSLEHVMMMLIPAAWEHDFFLDEALKGFYRFHACFMEPWDGPAAIAFTDGETVGAVLDRNGLRPARYIVTREGLVIMASEAGVIDIDPSNIIHSGRLEPGKMFLIDTRRGEIIDDAEIKKTVAARQPYGAWTRANMIDLDALAAPREERRTPGELLALLAASGWTREDLKMIIAPMAEQAKEPVGSMGNDTPHAIFSQAPRVIRCYFKQLFAQVTNPAIDPIREKLVMSLESFIGPEKNILEEDPGHCHKLKVENPILTNEDARKLRGISVHGFKAKTIPILFAASGGAAAFRLALDRICDEAERAIEAGYSFLILSDRGIDKDTAALPALLAVSAVHQHLIGKTIRLEAGVIVESAEAREVHDVALLFGYGADCVNPYLAYEAIGHLVEEKKIAVRRGEALANYRKALTDGILKILSKMGISTLRSYRGAQIFEALGLSSAFIKKYFTGTVSRLEGAGLEEIADETIKRHRDAYPKTGFETPLLVSGGIYQWRKDGEFHLWNPESIAALQDAARTNDYERYKEFARLINDQSSHPTTLRGLFKFKNAVGIPICEVEGAEEIMRRFATGAMSFGSISAPAHETIAIAMNRIGARSNTGEGGEDPARFIPLPNGDSRRSAIKQVASGRFGVTINYLVNADEIQIKIAQGAKPGEGGQLPGHKVSEIIAKTRSTTPGVTLISPPPHHDIYSIEDLAQLIFDLRNANPMARISVKLVSEAGVGTVAAGVAKGHADMILISGGDGGTGASPLSSIMHAGLPWELGLSETHQTLLLNNLRSRVRLQTDGQLRTGRDVAIAALLGAEEFGFCTAVLITIGCVMLRHCHLNNCSVGVATQDEILKKRFKGTPEYIVNYFHFVAGELREIMASLGLRTINEMIGRTDLLEIDPAKVPPKARGIDYSRLLYRPDLGGEVGRYYKYARNSDTDKVLDRKLIELCKGALSRNEPVKIEHEIKNTDRATGALLSGEATKRRGDGALSEDTITCQFRGVAGQSFGAFLARGITFRLEGMANDYVGKGISGGKIIIYPDKRSCYQPDKNIIIGNTSFYGGVSGEAYICGMAGERFCIRNSGVSAVVEGVGDHGCEYMTGGRVVVLGRTGRNFGAGMSGGIAYVYNEDGGFKDRCNMDMVLLEKPRQADRDELYNLIHNHFKWTNSRKAESILADMHEEMKKLVKVIPIEYKRILEGKAQEQKLGLLEASDG